jgi:hypothetical protein
MFEKRLRISDSLGESEHGLTVILCRFRISYRLKHRDDRHAPGTSSIDDGFGGLLGDGLHDFDWDAGVIEKCGVWVNGEDDM